MVVVDQFEELFTLCRDDASGSPSSTVCWPPGRTQRVVLTMRADFWGECAPYPALREVMQAHQELIAPMSEAELRSAMEQQARRSALRGAALRGRPGGHHLDDVRGEPGAMPLLQHALLELWKRRHGRWLRAAEYRAIGGVQQAIARTADDLCAQLPAADQARVRDVFLRLTRLDEDGAAAERERRAGHPAPGGAGRADAGRGDPAQTRGLVARLADARLVVTETATR